VWWPDMGCEKPTTRLRIRLQTGVSEVATELRVWSRSAVE
jgi:hypothetical protein